MRLQEKTLNQEYIYKGKIINLRRDTAELENGNTAMREVVEHSGGVCVVALTEQDEVIMVKQFRYPFSEVLLEIPAGKLEKDEDHRLAGLRELREETGYLCENFEYLGVTYPSVAYLNEKIHMYLATGLKFDKQELDTDEFLDVIAIKLEDALKMIETNEIKDGKTMTALLLTARKTL